MHVSIILGPASMFAHRMVNYTVYPSEFVKISPDKAAQLINFGRMGGYHQSVLTNNMTTCILVPSLMFLALTLLDDLNMFFALPCVASQAIIIS